MIAGSSNPSPEALDARVPAGTVLAMPPVAPAREHALEAPVSMARGMSNEECVAAARMTMWRLDGGHAR